MYVSDRNYSMGYTISDLNTRPNVMGRYISLRGASTHTYPNLNFSYFYSAVDYVKGCEDAVSVESRYINKIYY